MAKKIHKLFMKHHYFDLNSLFGMVFDLVETSVRSFFEMKLLTPLLLVESGIDLKPAETGTELL